MSTRRPFFTKEQVYFQCREFSCCECFDPVHSHGLTRDAQSDLRVGNFYTAISKRHIWDDIEEFTNRKLGRSDDTLNAMLGVLEKYQERYARKPDADFGATKKAFRNLSGLPLIRSTTMAIDGVATTNCSWETQILLALRWRLWIRYGTAVRRSAYPSWCWTGWTGRLNADWVQLTSVPQSADDQRNKIPCRILSVEDTHGKIIVRGSISLESNLQHWSHGSRLRTHARFLAIESAVFDVVTYFRKSTKSWVLVALYGELGDQYELDGYEYHFIEACYQHKLAFEHSLDSCNPSRGKALKGLILETFSPNARAEMVPVLLLRGRDPVERLDFVALPHTFVKAAKPQLRTVRLG